MAELILRCTVCRSVLDEEDLFCPNCGTESPSRPSVVRPEARWATYNFQCKGCGASMSYDAREQALRCPFCGSVELEKRPDAKILAPRRVIPFVIDQTTAVAAMREYLRRGFLRPGDLSQRAIVVNIRPVYVPYWVFSAQTHTNWTADSSRTPPQARADWYPMSGERSGRHAGILVGGSCVLTPAETEAIGPFDLGRSVGPDQVDLENITVEQFSVPKKYVRALASHAIEAAEAAACRAGVPGSCRNLHVNVLIDEMAGEPVLLPVWVLAYRYGDRVFRLLVNGQSGRVAGRVPSSPWRVALLVVVALFVAGATALAALLGLH